VANNRFVWAKVSNAHTRFSELVIESPARVVIPNITAVAMATITVIFELIRFLF
jgi:hypothetical protein